MKEPISIKEILAVVVKRGAAIICVALACAVLLGGLQGVRQLRTVKSPDNTAEAVKQRNDVALETYQIQYAIGNSMLENAQYKLDKQIEYNAESLYMQLDPYNKYKSYIILAVTEVESDAFQQVYEQEGTPVDYIISKIANQYVLCWRNLDVMSELENNPFADSTEKYIREIANVSYTAGGTITIYANANSAAEAMLLCESIYEKILEKKEAIQDATYDHELTVISSATKQEIDYTIDQQQIINREHEDTYRQAVLEAKSNLDLLVKPAVESVQTMSSVVKTTVKWAVIGGVVGFLMACACVWLWYILTDGVETSRQAEVILGTTFLGSAASRGKLFRRLANWLVEERCWKDQEQAAAYIAESVKSSVNAASQIALISTTRIKEEDDGVQMVLQTLRQLGHTVVYANEAESNAKALAAMRESALVIQVERLGTSNRQAMLHTAQMAKQLNAKVLGFITV